MNYELRVAVKSDAYAISLLLRKAMLTYCANSCISSNLLEAMNEDLSAIEHRIENNCCLCCFKDGEAVATITLGIIDTPLKLSFSDKTYSCLASYQKVGYISRFAVREDCRNEGLGNKLMSEALSKARENNLQAVLLHSSVSNKTMSEFYSKRGFIVLDSEDSRGYQRGLFLNSLG